MPALGWALCWVLDTERSQVLKFRSPGCKSPALTQPAECHGQRSHVSDSPLLQSNFPFPHPPRRVDAKIPLNNIQLLGSFQQSFQNRTAPHIPKEAVVTTFIK